MAVSRVIWFCVRSTTDTAPREELKTLEICIPPAEIVMFTKALEEERALIDRRDAIMRDEMIKEVRTPRIHTLKFEK